MAYFTDNSKVSDKEILTWTTFGDASRELAQNIVDSDFTPDIVVAIARGGLVLAGALTYALGVKLSDAVNIEFYTDVHQTLPDPVLLAPMLDIDSIKGKNVLLVDDVADSGRTLKLTVELLAQYDTNVRSAVLYTKPRTIILPDYSWKDTDKWISFPWSDQPPVTKSVL
ncbi:phosphoribosyltransferase [Arcanobacterium hippocoleae]|uniref:Hypoxanthine phosphoribosyltransferase n=1 Tax=Arcanobacterium hippocoleae TaxID=149017 RepID=A0ABU1T0S3_9ACTO|nr:phosphoribosyltransferase [Arcanobacterium hippocoleae]MDR6938977.1 hypoxanthine phosphoribosyltransferase [Arcanobacterium hippocoleae]